MNGPDEQPTLENNGSIAQEPTIESGGRDDPADETLDAGPSHVNAATHADELKPRGDEPNASSAAPPKLTAAAIAKLLVPMDKAALDLLTPAEIHARRCAMYAAKRKWEMRR
jgi:hypothetical protein